MQLLLKQIQVYASVTGLTDRAVQMVRSGFVSEGWSGYTDLHGYCLLCTSYEIKTIL